MHCWKWSNGETNYKSSRHEHNSQMDAIKQSLDDNTLFSRNQNASSNRRENIDYKIADREMIAQRGVNPFVSSSYVNDIVAHDLFLKPMNTTHEKEKNKEHFV